MIKAQPPQQQEGWRVKLYRLNADGSWDDCGTGRILCLYKQQQQQQQQSKETSTTLTATTTNNNNNNNSTPPLTGEAWIYQELGEPTLCMHAEVNHHHHHNNNNNNNNSSSSSSPSSPRILLRTRILLRDAYQRQGDNIITWCEPYLEEGNPTQGVDLALSFQDNAGCLDIWRQITQVQSKAGDYFRRDNNTNNNNNNNNTSSEATITSSRGSNNNNNNNEESDVTDDVTSSLGGSGDNNNNMNGVQHQQSLQEQEQQDMWVNVSSDHLGGGGGGGDHDLENQQQQQQDNNSNNDSTNHQQQQGEQQQTHHHHPPHFEDAMSSFHEPSSCQSINGNNNINYQPQLPNPPTLGTLEDIADTIAAVQVCCSFLLHILYFLFFQNKKDFFPVIFCFVICWLDTFSQVALVIFILYFLALFLLSILKTHTHTLMGLDLKKKTAYSTKRIVGNVHFTE